MPNYYIVAVRYTDVENRTFISSVKTIEPQGEKSRSAVVGDIARGCTVKTAVRRTDGKCYEGADVHIVTINHIKYLRTDGNSRASDNLGSLPTY